MFLFQVNFNRNKTGIRKDVQSSISIGDDVTSTTKAIEQHESKRSASLNRKEKRVSSATSTSTKQETTVRKTSLEKQNKSSGVASTVVQSSDQEAAIMAVNKDKFASSLRESAGVQIGVQKDLSVIDAHRRQSMANSSYQQQSYQQQQQQQQQQQHSSSLYQQQQNYGNFYGETFIHLKPKLYALQHHSIRNFPRLLKG